MDDRQRRTGYYLLLLAAVMAGYSVLYYVGMIYLEGEQVSFLHAVQVVVETFTTTGFGSDSPWRSDVMNVLVIVMDLTGVLIIFLALPVLLFPLFEERLSRNAPTSVEGLSDHVVIAGYSPRGAALVEELTARGRDHVFVEPDRELADELDVETDLTVVHGDPETAAALRAAGIEEARALVADVDDEVNASVVLAARSIADCTVVTLVEEAGRGVPPLRRRRRGVQSPSANRRVPRQESDRRRHARTGRGRDRRGLRHRGAPGPGGL
jgi:hypothetical protein